jgi:hypothetical protein
MKVIATIFQCKRVAFPYFFIKYCVPKMKELSGFDFEIYLIQHTTPETNRVLTTCRESWSKIENVQQWTKDGKFTGANIIQHSENDHICPAFPSYKIGVETALKEKADLHIWLEDDAMILDKNPKKWLEIKCVGTYQNWWRFIPVRHTITTRSFDGLMLHKMNTEKWDIRNFTYDNKGFVPLKGHPEHFTTECCKERLELDEKDIAYNHCLSTLNMDLIREIVPKEEIHFLNLDYPQSQNK